MIIKYLILSFIQGIIEPLPISSSGHMILFKNVFNFRMPNNLNFEIICNFGSFIAIFVIFRKDLFRLINNFIKYILNKNNRLKYKNYFSYIIKIIISTTPVCITGFLFKDKIENLFSSMYFLGFAFLLTAFMLFMVRNKNGCKDDYLITYKDAIIIGIIQSITIIPGISRSGSVLVACLFCNLKKDTAIKYTFMLYFPVSLASLILGINDLINMPNFDSYLFLYLISIITSAIVTLLSYNLLINWVKNSKLHYFAIYCILLSIFIFYFFR